MSRENTYLSDRLQVLPSRLKSGFRPFTWVACLAAVLAVPGTTQAAIVFTDTSNLATPWTYPFAEQGGSTLLTASNAFTVSATPGTSVLVVPVEYYSSNPPTQAADIAATQVNWVVGNVSYPLTAAASQASVNSSFVASQVFYMFNPPDGAGTITYSGSARSYAYNAYTLSLVNTSTLPVPYLGTASTTTNPTTLTLASSTVANSFVATSEAVRTNNANPGPLSWTFTASTVAASLPWFYPPPTENQVAYAAGYVNGLPAGATTIGSSIPAAQLNTNTTRNVMAAAVFTPLVAPSGAMTWAGTGGSGNWDFGGTKNWQSPSSLGFYLEPNNGVIFDDSGPTAGGTTNVVVAQVVSPASVTFNNNAHPYAFTASGGGAISGTGAVTLSGSGLVALNIANTYSGGTNVNAGTLQVGNANGSATGTGPVAIAAGATLTGGGFISTSGTNAVSVSGTITPDPSPPGTYNTLTASALSLNSGSTLNLNFLTSSPGQHDLINVTGNLTLGSGTVNINVANQSGTWTPGSYPFANYGTLTNGNPTLIPVNTFGALGSSQMSIDESAPGVISLDVLSAAASKTVSWAGNVNTGGSHLWDINNTLNWTSSGSASAYNEGNEVVFSNTASNFVVTVNQQVNPSSVIFSNSSNSYTLGGSGGINSTTLGVAINGGGTVTFNNTNNYSSVTTVTNGSTLIVNGSLPNSNVLVTGASIGGNGQLGATPASLTLNGATALTAGSNLSVNGAANVVSGTFSIPASATLSGTGGINVGPGAQLAYNSVEDFNQIINLNSAVLSGSGTLNGGLANSGVSSITSGIISANGALTGSGTLNVASGSELLLGGAATTAGLTLNISGTLPAGGTLNSPVIVSGNGQATINVGTLPSFTALGGTTSLAGATVNVATVSGSNAVVNVTAGNMPILNVTNSNPTSGVTIGAGASACTTSASVSGGLVTLNDNDTIPTATLSGGTTNLNAPTVNVATISGTNTVVNVTGGQVLRFSSSGGSTTIGSLASAFTATVSGTAVVNLNNTNPMDSFTASGGTTNYGGNGFGPSVPVAAISGTNTVVNITAGSIPTLTVNGSSLIGGVTAGTGASVGSTAVNVSGGLVTMNNTDTIPTATLSGGTTNFNGPTLTVANVSGSAVVKVNVGSVATLTQSGSASTTVAAAATVTNASVYGGLANLNPTSGLSGLIVGGGRVNVSNTSALTLLAVSGGTVSLPAGATSVAYASFALAGTAAQVTPGTLVVSNQLTFNGGAAAAISNGNTLTYTNSSNMANTTAANTLTFTGGVLTFSPSLSAGPAINIETGNHAYTGVGPAPDAGTTWNAPVINSANVALLNSSGGTTSVTFTAAGQGGTFTTANPNALLNTYGYGTATAMQTFTFAGLTPGAAVQPLCGQQQRHQRPCDDFHHQRHLPDGHHPGQLANRHRNDPHRLRRIPRAVRQHQRPNHRRGYRPCRNRRQRPPVGSL